MDRVDEGRNRRIEARGKVGASEEVALGAYGRKGQSSVVANTRLGALAMV